MNLTKEIIDSIKITPLIDTLKFQKIDDEEYFSAKYSNYISNSRLSFINPEQDNDPKKFFEGFGKHKIYSTALDIGSGVHMGCLQPEYFLIPDIDKPTAKMGVVADIIYNKCKGIKPSRECIISATEEAEYFIGKMTDTKIDNILDKCNQYWKDRREFEESYNDTKTLFYLDVRSRNTVNSCISAINKNKNIQDLLHPKGLVEDPVSDNEQAILLDVKVEIPNYDPFILKLKAKVDNYTIDREVNTVTCNDIKTIGKILSEFDCKGGNIDKFHYYREISLYSWLLCLCAKKFYNIDNPNIKGNYLVVSTIPQYYSKVVPMKSKDFKKGWDEFVYLLKIVAYYTATEYKDFGIWMS